ncbi:MAG: type II/IV secretion system protein [SAR324 cluster bacterium]|nr:type II/IV secretion system protein [SAR324 cluster bacterium]
MSLLDELIEQDYLEESLLDQLGTQNRHLGDIEKIRQLARQQLMDENHLSAFFSQRYQIPLLSQTEQLPRLHSDLALTRHVFQDSKILLIFLGETQACLLSLYSDILSLDKIAYHFDAPLLRYWSTSQQMDAMWQLSEDANRQHTELSIVDLTRHILEQAIGQRCSDIHFEAGDKSFVVRFRLDGHLHDEMELPLEMQSPLLSRLKILAGMDVAVKRRPQDGYHKYRSGNGDRFDLRMSSIPTEMGEKLVIRLLDQTPVQYKLEALGFLPDDLQILHQACQMQSGLILVVGPTGSGKTTTLYAMLNEMNSREKNIMTVEDPVEYHLPDINQVSVQPEQNLSFAQTLRAFLRQDPDIILVGEIRDEETAEIAIKAALTGHLVLSTLHSADAVTTIQRLKNLGVDLDLLADTLKVILSQRLVRRLCPHLNKQEQKDCLRCRGTGYSGRVPVYEILHVNRTISSRIKSGKLSNDLIAPEKGVFFHSFEQTIQRLITEGVTDHHEVDTLLVDF